MFKIGICNELFEDTKLSRVCRLLKEIGYDGVEIAPFTLATVITELTGERRREIKAMVEDAGLETIGLHWLLAKTEGLYLTSPDASVRRATGDYLIALAEATRDLGGTLMVLGSPKQRSLLPGVSFDQAFGYAVEVFHRVMPAIAAAGVTLCFEPLAPNDTDFVNTCQQGAKLVANVNHRHFRLHMDVKAQSSEQGYSVSDLIKMYAWDAGHFHAQDVNLRGPGMGQVDFNPIMAALVGSGYKGWVSVEAFDFSPGAEATARRSIACLKSALAESGALRK
jgi:sugar phosphate isomerase/epimerase